MAAKNQVILASLAYLLHVLATAECAVVISSKAALPMNSYHHYNDMNNFLQNLEATYPNLAHVYSVGKSVEGRDLLVIQISDNVQQREIGEPRVKYIANMHGNEPVGRQLTLYFAEYLLSNYGTDQRVTDLVDNTDIHLMPSMNPDGFEASREGDCDSVSGRYNANGVDLNRNFPDQFESPTAAIQPETDAIMKWIDTQPNFVISANFHGGTLVANYPFDNSQYGYTSGHYSMSPDDVIFRQIATVYANAHPTMHQNSVCAGLDHFAGGITNGAHWYEVGGGMQDYNYLKSNTFEITVEQSCCKYPMGNNLASYWNANRVAMMSYLEQAHIGIKGVITDNSGAAVADAEVHVSGIDHVVTTSDKGEYWRLLAPGDYQVTIKKAGFTTITRSVTVSSGSAQVIDATLTASSGRRNSWRRFKARSG